jgi:hypothetical protein
MPSRRTTQTSHLYEVENRIARHRFRGSLRVHGFGDRPMATSAIRCDAVSESPSMSSASSGYAILLCWSRALSVQESQQFCPAHVRRTVQCAHRQQDGDRHGPPTRGTAFVPPRGWFAPVHPVVDASLTPDHRATDGHRGGPFLLTVDRLLQEPENL